MAARAPAVDSGPTDYRPRDNTDWEVVEIRHDSDRTIDRGGGDRNGTSRHRNAGAPLSCVPGGPNDSGDDPNRRKSGRNDSKRGRPTGPDRDSYDRKSRGPWYPRKVRYPPGGYLGGGGGGLDDDPSDSDAGTRDDEQKR